MNSVKFIMAAAGLAMAAAPAFAETPASEGPAVEGTSSRRSEVMIGLLAHGVNIEGTPPAGTALWEGTEEAGTVDVQFGYRSRAFDELRWLLRPRAVVKADINTGGRTSFVSAGAEWRQHFLGDRVYVQAGVGVAYQTGYRMTPNPFEPGFSQGEFERRHDLYLNRTSFGSSVLFNPNLSAGVRLSDRWALEAMWEHYSHKRLFGRQNPGIDNFGVRLVYGLGRR